MSGVLANVQALALTLPDPFDAQTLAVDLARHLLAVPLSEADERVLGDILL